MSNSLQIETGKDGAIWIKSTTVSSRLTILKGAFINAVVGVDHAADAIGLSKLVDGSHVIELVRLHGLHLVLLGEETFENGIFDLIDSFRSDPGLKVDDVTRIIYIVLKFVQKFLQRWHLERLTVLVHEVDLQFGVDPPEF